MQEEEGHHNVELIKSLQEELGIYRNKKTSNGDKKLKETGISLVTRIQNISMYLLTREEERT